MENNTTLIVSEYQIAKIQLIQDQQDDIFPIKMIDENETCEEMLCNSLGCA